MTHFLGIVVAKDARELAKVIERFDEQFRFPHHFVPVDGEELEHMCRILKLDPNDNEAIAANVMEWFGRAYATVDGKHGYISNSNPHGRYDWYQVPGRWEGAVPTTAKIEELPAIFEKAGWWPSTLVDWAGWHSNERVGWFGTSALEPDPVDIQERLKTFPPGTNVFLVDFHV